MELSINDHSISLPARAEFWWLMGTVRACSGLDLYLLMVQLCLALAEVYAAMSLPNGNYWIYFERQDVAPNCR